MKQLLTYKPQFNPTSKTLDFSTLPNFSISKLYAVINVTRNAPIYIAGASGLGATLTSKNILTLTYNTTSHSSSDVLNIYYDSSSVEADVATESGNLQRIAQTMDRVLIELQVLNYIAMQGFIGVSLNNDDIDALRRDLNQANDINKLR
jgi:hypothetical protein